MRRKSWIGMLSGIVACILAVTIAAPAKALYIYLPGEWLHVRTGSTVLRCTGAYFIVVGGRSYQVTAGHCGALNSQVSNKGFPIGTIAHTGYRPSGNTFTGWDTALIRPTTGASWQMVIDPITRQPVASNNKVMEVGATRNLVQGYYVAKGGTTTGVTRGPITAYTRWGADIAYCAQMRTLPGDSGGPVFRRESYGMVAIGVVVAYASGGSVGCFVPMDEILRRWGGYLPSFRGNLYPNPAIAAAAVGSTGQVLRSEGNGLPMIDPSQLKSAALP